MTQGKKRVLILMASFNGAKYIKDQLNSIIHQTYLNWRLIVRDDESNDETVAIIGEYVSRYSNIRLIKGEKNVGSVRNFSLLLDEVSDADYVMFADQDDVWKPNKIANYVERIVQEEKLTPEIPILLYSNLTYVDEGLTSLEKGIRYSLEPNQPLKMLLFQNWIYGCTMMLNLKLVQLVKSIPPEMENHDYWVSLVASACGRIVHIDESYILYRQHHNNVSGQYDFDSLSNRLKRILGDRRRQAKRFANKYVMTLRLYQRHKERMTGQNRALLSGFLKASGHTGFTRVFFALKNRIMNPGTAQTLLSYFYLLVVPPTNKDEFEVK